MVTVTRAELMADAGAVLRRTETEGPIGILGEDGKVGLIVHPLGSPRNLRVFNVAAIEVVSIDPPIGGVRWVQLRCLHAGDDSPLLVQLPERAWHDVAGCTMRPTEKAPDGECAVCGNCVGP